MTLEYCEYCHHNHRLKSGSWWYCRYKADYQDLIKFWKGPIGSKERPTRLPPNPYPPVIRIVTPEGEDKEIVGPDIFISPPIWWQMVRHLIRERDGQQCYYCHAKESYKDYLEVHHIIPRILGGTDHPDNLITVCFSCHVKQHRKFGGFNPTESAMDLLDGKQKTIAYN